MYHEYILTNSAGTVLYSGVTHDLKHRVYEHKAKSVPGFTARYNTAHLVYYEATEDIRAAIARERQIKGGSRKKKLALIAALNRDWRDLYDEV